jgi:anti-sigma B factor antagonist
MSLHFIDILLQARMHNERDRQRFPSRREDLGMIRRTMDIVVRKTGDVTIVDFNGRLAAGVSDTLLPRMIQEILDEGSKKILLNLSNMDYIDSNGLGELVQSYREAQRAGAKLCLLKPQDRVAKTLRLTNLLPMFKVYESEHDALADFAS